MPVSCHFQGCKALLRIVKRRYIKYHAFAFRVRVTLFCPRNTHEDRQQPESLSYDGHELSLESLLSLYAVLTCGTVFLSQLETLTIIQHSDEHSSRICSIVVLPRNCLRPLCSLCNAQSALFIVGLGTVTLYYIILYCSLLRLGCGRIILPNTGYIVHRRLFKSTYRGLLDRGGGMRSTEFLMIVRIHASTT